MNIKTKINNFYKRNRTMILVLGGMVLGATAFAVGNIIGNKMYNKAHPSFTMFETPLKDVEFPRSMSIPEIKKALLLAGNVVLTDSLVASRPNIPDTIYFRPAIID